MIIDNFLIALHIILLLQVYLNWIECEYYSSRMLFVAVDLFQFYWDSFLFIKMTLDSLPIWAGL